MPSTSIDQHQDSLSDSETLDILADAHGQFEEYLKLLEIPDFSDFSEEPQPVYSWDNPIGLVFTDTDDSTSAIRFKPKS